MSGSIGWGWLPQDNGVALGTENLPVDRRSEKNLVQGLGAPEHSCGRGTIEALFNRSPAYLDRDTL